MAMLNLEIDGKPVQVAAGKTVMDAAHQLGLYVPHFCWHKKLTIAANCRMCLVQVEKAPKPLPACATPATEGMKVWTHSEGAVTAQKGVMEFLLINHPLDCPICDQGGECQLQDLAVGYGASSSRYNEPKRVVLNKNLGPLISTDMTRCIHCTRCVRFGQEIAGVMELGMAGRGEHAEIMSFVGRTVDSELSGNMIDLCPVGALTSKPFRYSARTWELARRKSISPHDGLGSNLIVQVKNERVMRVVPLENEAVNECWLSDKDRFSYEGLNSEDRLTRPQMVVGGALTDTDWQTALERVATELKRIVAEHGPRSIGVLASPHSTLEELHLAQKFVRGLGCDNIDFRLRQTDFTASGTPWLGMPVTEFAALDRALVVGSFLRKDHPLLAQRLRQSTKKGAQLSIVHSAHDELLMKVANEVVVAPSALPRALAEIVVAAAAAAGKAAPDALAGLEPSAAAKAIAASLRERRAQGHLPRQFRAAASARIAIARAGPDAGGVDRRAAGISDRGCQFGRRPRRASAAPPRRIARPSHAGGAPQGVRVAPRRTRTRHGRSRDHSPRAGGGGVCRRAVAVPFGGGTVRRRAAAGRTLCRNGGNLRQLRRPRAGVRRGGTSARRDPPGMEGLARVGLHARLARVRFRQRRSGASRVARKRRYRVAAFQRDTRGCRIHGCGVR